MTPQIPTEADLSATLGPALDVWREILAAVSERFGPVVPEWKPSKSGFGRMCLLRQKKRTLLYLTPEDGQVQVAIVLGERAAADALAGRLPEAIKELIREARPYAEGRGIRFPVSSLADVAVVAELVGFKMAPR